MNKDNRTSGCACPAGHEHEPQRIPEGSTIRLGPGGTIIIEPPEEES